MDPARCREAVLLFLEVLSLRAVGLSFVASADIYVVFLGSFFEIPNTIEKLKPRIAESTYFVGGLAVPSSENGNTIADAGPDPARCRAAVVFFFRVAHFARGRAIFCGKCRYLRGISDVLFWDCQHYRDLKPRAVETTYFNGSSEVFSLGRLFCERQCQ